MREKPVSEKTISKYIDFLYSVKENALPYEHKISLSEIAINHAINKTAPKALEKLGIIKKISTIRWEWLDGYDGLTDRELALKVLDFLLHMNKKTIHTPIMPEYATDIAAITKTLAEIRDNISETNKSLDRLKTSRFNKSKDLPVIQSEQIHGETLFTEADQRFGIIKAITSGIYGAIFGGSEPSPQRFLLDRKYRLINDIIIRSTEDLMNKAFKKMPVDEVDKTVIGVCAVCMKSIKADEQYTQSNDSGNYYCYKHTGDAKINTKHRLY